ncbi:DUF3570 domain-containing protein [Maribellus sp. YY47]|uniref:DUF3570 domain-containing protein n=1 Tax=Maribellus sp. YY47 TaxID=2929486 RepID=UPI002000A804|nr:DUF3570 domain-containing protein [Maribellus sp. YY47]MCK3685029.1 DUF3570 domain-containing protein [Maribellus sp. YY47]
MKVLLSIFLILLSGALFAQTDSENNGEYKKRVLENAEVEFLMNYYEQSGENAAVTGGKGTEELQDLSPTIVVSVPLNDDDVLTINANISAYSSASSSNIDPFDGKKPADPFVASSGASKSDVWINGIIGYSHSSDDRNRIWSADLSFSAEFDYTSVGGGGSYTWLFNEKNTEFSLHGNVYIDTWSLIYPIELRPSMIGGTPGNQLIQGIQIQGNYNPEFNEITSKGRNSYSAGFGFSQILSSRMNAYLSADFILQDGLLSTPFHRVYFSDVEDAFAENFHLAEGIEHLPNSRFKTALGGRLNYFVNERVTIRTYYRYYFDDWGITSNTASIEIPVKITDKFTIYPSYRYYDQTAADYFAPYNQHLSTEQYYTSDYDLSKFNSNNFGLGVSYTDVFTSKHIYKFGLKSIDLKYNKYDRDSKFSASMFSLGVKFVFDD